MPTRAALRFADCAVTGTAHVRPNSAFVVTSVRLPYGMRVTVVLDDVSAEQVSLEGIVRWSSADGVGIQFDRPRAREVRAIYRLLKAA